MKKYFAGIFLLLLGQVTWAANCKSVLSPALVSALKETSPRISEILATDILRRYDRASKENPVFEEIARSIAFCERGELCGFSTSDSQTAKKTPLHFDLEISTRVDDMLILNIQNLALSGKAMGEQVSEMNPTLFYFLISILKGTSQFIQNNPNVKTIEINGRWIINPSLAETLESLGMKATGRAPKKIIPFMTQRAQCIALGACTLAQFMAGTAISLLSWQYSSHPLTGFLAGAGLCGTSALTLLGGPYVLRLLPSDFSMQIDL